MSSLLDTFISFETGADARREVFFFLSYIQRQRRDMCWYVIVAGRLWSALWACHAWRINEAATGGLADRLLNAILCIFISCGNMHIWS
jgi:hypothetical protein